MKPSLKKRLVAWWEGYEIHTKTPQGSFETPERQPIVSERESNFSARVECLNQIWGDGFISAGDAGFCCDLVRPAGLTEELSMLDLSAGLGGPARAISREFGVWIAGLELDRELAIAGLQMSDAAGMAKKVAITPFIPEKIELPESKYDCVMAKELMFCLADKREMLRKIEKSLKKGGHYFCLDFVARDGRLGKQSLVDWAAAEPCPPDLIEATDATNMITECGLELRVAHDQTEAYLAQIKATWGRWQEIVDAIAAFKIKDAMMVELAKVVRRSTKLTEVIECGDLKVMSFHATKRIATKQISDW